MPTIYVYEDEKAIRYSYSAILSSIGMTVIEHSDTKHLSEHSPDQLADNLMGADMIVTDGSMPGIEGIELIRRARQGKYSRPIALITGTPFIYSIDIEKIKEAYPSSQTMMFGKPMSLVRLCDLVKSMLNH